MSHVYLCLRRKPHLLSVLQHTTNRLPPLANSELRSLLSLVTSDREWPVYVGGISWSWEDTRCLAFDMANVKSQKPDPHGDNETVVSYVRHRHQPKECPKMKPNKCKYHNLTSKIKEPFTCSVHCLCDLLCSYNNRAGRRVSGLYTDPAHLTCDLNKVMFFFVCIQGPIASSCSS